MKFGKIQDPKILDKMQWKLPTFDALTKPFLATLATPSTKLLLGAPAWNHKEWVGKVYPPKTRVADYLFHYSRYFNTIELNTTHYRIPTEEQTKKWCSQVPTNFVFCPKLFQGISHDRSGLLDIQLLKTWFQFLESIGSNLGPCFLQLPPSFDYSCKTLLFKFLQLWPNEFKLAIEFRHPSWFQGGVIIPALVQYLQTRRIGLVITDVAGRQDVLHSSISAEFAMVRFVGNALHASDFERAQLWNERLQGWQNQGLPEVIFLVHEPDDILVPELTTHLLNEVSFFKTYYPVTLPKFDLDKPPGNLDLFNSED